MIHVGYVAQAHGQVVGPQGQIYPGALVFYGYFFK